VLGWILFLEICFHSAFEEAIAVKSLTISVKLMVVDGLVYVWHSVQETMFDFLGGYCIHTADQQYQIVF